MIATRFAAGVLGAGIFVPSVRLISAWFPSGNRGLAIGLFGAGTSVGGIVVSFSSPFIALLLEWRWSVRTLTFLGFFIAFMIGLWLRDAPQTASISKGSGSLKEIISSRAFWILGYDQLIRLGLTYAASAWLPTFVSESYGLSTATASLSLTLMNLIGVFSNPGGGMLSDRMGEIKSALPALAFITPAVFLLAAYRDLILIWVLIGILGFFINFLRSPLFSILPKIYGLRQSGAVTGYQNTFASAGAFLFPFVIGSSRDISGSFTTGWISLAILCVPAILPTLTLLRYDKIRKTD
jgi:NNP family nitrate/nitrite transporter-like MFS transporter